MLTLTHYWGTGVRIYHSDDLVAYEKGINDFAKTIHSSTSSDFKNFYLDIIVKWIDKQAKIIKIKLEDSLGNYQNLFMPTGIEGKDFIFTIKDKKKFDFFGISGNQNDYHRDEIKLAYDFPNHKIQKGYYENKIFIPELLKYLSNPKKYFKPTLLKT